eukprot:478986_1
MSHISSQMSKIIACYTILVHYLVLGDFNTTRISFGSCSFPHKDTSIFNIMSQRNPDIFIWTGDATYLDYENYDPSSAMDTITVAVNGGIDPAPIDTWEKTWNIMNADANYKQFIDTLPVLTGVWDDHEYGLNDANGLNNFKNKDYLLRIDEMKADYTWFDGVEQCVYTGRNFGEIEIEWKWNQNISDFEIKNIDGLIFNIDGDKECELDIPLWNDNNNNINYDENGYYLTDLDDYRCYGGIKQFSQADVDSQSFKQIMFIIVIYGG